MFYGAPVGGGGGSSNSGCIKGWIVGMENVASGDSGGETAHNTFCDTDTVHILSPGLCVYLLCACEALGHTQLRHKLWVDQMHSIC